MNSTADNPSYYKIKITENDHFIHFIDFFCSLSNKKFFLLEYKIIFELV